MSKFKTKTIFSSITYAYRGIAIALKSQKNFRFDIIFGIIVLIFAVFLKFSRIEFVLLIMSINAVLFAELINTVIEFVIDAYYGNRYSIIAKMSKDIAAGAVLITAICATSIGLLLFVPKIFRLLQLNNLF
jgi:diacylglycerol kinase